MKRTVRGNVMSTYARKGQEVTLEDGPSLQRLIDTGVLDDLGAAADADAPHETNTVAADHLVDDSDQMTSDEPDEDSQDHGD